MKLFHSSILGNRGDDCSSCFLLTKDIDQGLRNDTASASLIYLQELSLVGMVSVTCKDIAQVVSRETAKFLLR